eukprot:320083-Chlamydomonas_euryale.AAC.5
MERAWNAPEYSPKPSPRGGEVLEIEINRLYLQCLSHRFATAQLFGWPALQHPCMHAICDHATLQATMLALLRSCPR